MATTDTDWKHKYLKALDQLERLQQLERARLDVMRRGLARVSVAAQGQDEQLDSHLDELRNALRQQRDVLELEQLLTSLETAVKGLDTRRRKQSSAVAELIDTQLGRYITSELDRGTRRKLMAFRKKYPLLPTARNAQMELLRSFSGLTDAIIRYQMERLAELKKPERKGVWSRWWARWFRREESGMASASGASGVPQPFEVDHQASPMAQQTSPLQQPSLVVQGVVAVPDPRPDEMNLAESPDSRIDTFDIDTDTRTRIRTVLGQLLVQIDVPASLRNRRDGLLATLEKPLDWTRFPSLLAEVGEFVNALRSLGQAELEGFLVSLYQRLQDIQDFLLHARTREAESYVHQQQLAEDVRNELANIRESVHSGTDLLRVRVDIEKVVGRIIAAMNDFQKIEAERHQSLNDGMEQMARRMQSMEEEAQDLRDKLEAQRRQSQRDALTDLPNRTATDEAMESALNRVRYKGKSVALAVLAIDDFDGVNDVLGHLRGDKVLKLVARELRRRARPEDFVGRHAGETFVVISDGVDTLQMNRLMDILRQTIMACPFNFNGERIPVTISGGIVLCTGEETSERLFDRADQAMRRARRLGRNRIDIAERVT
jgi:diguanylate cyclase